MSAPTDSSGTLRYWQNGIAFDGVNKTGNGNGSLKFWADGLPGSAIFAASAPPSASTITIYTGHGDLFNLLLL